jgi:hypothetical protein
MQPLIKESSRRKSAAQCLSTQSANRIRNIRNATRLARDLMISEIIVGDGPEN